LSGGFRRGRLAESLTIERTVAVVVRTIVRAVAFVVVSDIGVVVAPAFESAAAFVVPLREDQVLFGPRY
jgi:hypothetical protein